MNSLSVLKLPVNTIHPSYIVHLRPVPNSEQYVDAAYCSNRIYLPQSSVKSVGVIGRLLIMSSDAINYSSNTNSVLILQLM